MTRLSPEQREREEPQQFDLKPSPRVLPMLGEINLIQWRCLAELVDNSVDAFIAVQRATGKKPPDPEVHVYLPSTDEAEARVTVTDNGPGMSAEQLESAVSAGWSGNDPLTALGMYGMGFNIATARLGRVTHVWTTRQGDPEWVSLKIDFDELIENKHFQTPILRRTKTDPSQHGTEVIVENLQPQQRAWLSKPGNRTRLQEELRRAYSSMLVENGQPIQFKLYVNSRSLRPIRHCVWGGPENKPRVVQTPRYGPVDAYQTFDRSLEPRPYCTRCLRWLPVGSETCLSCQKSKYVVTRQRAIRGWLGIQRYLSKTDFGIDFIRHGRKIELASKDLFYWMAEGILEPEYPIDDPRNRGRIVGEIHIDHCRVSYTKDRFDRNDPAWEEMVNFVRGEGPLRPEKAEQGGFAPNMSPLARLFNVFRRNAPKGKTAGGYYRLLVVPDNDKATEYADRFHDGDPAYQTDDKWWELIEEAERDLLLQRPTGPSAPATAPSPGDALAGFGQSQTGTTVVAVPIPVARTRVASLSQRFTSALTQQTWEVVAYRTTPEHEWLQGGRPWVLRRMPEGEHEFVYDAQHPAFNSATLTPEDALLNELAYSAADFLRGLPNQQRGATFAEILADLRERYATRSKLDPVVLSGEAKQSLLTIARTLPKNLDRDDAAVLFRELPKQDQKAIFERMATRAVDRPQEVISRGGFLEHSPPAVLLDFFRRHPELFLDGKCWPDPYGSLNYEYPETTKIAQEQVVRKYESLLADAVWLADRDGGDLQRAARAQVLRAMYALEILTPEEDAAED